MNKRIVIYILFGFVLLLLVAGFVYFNFGGKVETSSLQVKDISVLDDMLQISGTTMSSALAFAGYDYKIADQNLYLTIRYVLVNPLHKSGDLNISIYDNLKEVNKVFLQGREKNDLQLVWSK